MKAIKILLLLCLPLVVGSCKGKTGRPAEIKILKGYFFKNTHTVNETSFFVFPGTESFYDYFGIARTMDNNVDEPDFTKDIVAAIVCRPVNNKTEIVITKIEKSSDAADVHFEIKTGESISFSMQPLVVFGFAKDENIRSVNFITNGETQKTVTFNRRTADAPQSLDDLKKNYTGTFTGVLPCADCPGIQTTLTLNADYTYTLELVYQDRNDAKALLEQGKWTPSEDLAFVELNYDTETGSTYYALLDKNTVEKLDRNAQPMQSNLNFKLVRK